MAKNTCIYDKYIYNIHILHWGVLPWNLGFNSWSSLLANLFFGVTSFFWPWWPQGSVLQFGNFTIWNDEDFHEHHPLKALCCWCFSAGLLTLWDLMKGVLPLIALRKPNSNKDFDPPENMPTMVWTYYANSPYIIYPPPTHKFIDHHLQTVTSRAQLTGERCSSGTAGALGKFLWMSQKSHLFLGVW